VRAATERARAEVERRDAGVLPDGRRSWKVVAPARDLDRRSTLLDDAEREGWSAKELAQRVLLDAGFELTSLDAKGAPKPVRLRHGADVAFAAVDATGTRWLFDLAGSFTRGNDRAGLRPTDVVWKTLGKAAVIANAETEPYRLVVLTTELPAKGQPTAGALREARGAGKPIFDIIDLLDDAGRKRLARYARSGPGRGPTGDLHPGPAR
jgi:hypothetical protein